VGGVDWSVEMSASAIAANGGPTKPLRFVHITKNAGTTIEEVGKPNWGKFDGEYRDAVSEVYGNPWAWWHVPPQFMNRSAQAALRKKYDYFAVVRNPFDRVVSEYYCRWGGPNKKLHDAARANTWINNRLVLLEREIATFEANRAREQGGKWQPGRTFKPLEGHWIPQHVFLVDEKGEAFVPNENLIRFENLVTDFGDLMARYGYSETYRIDSHHNKSAAETAGMDVPLFTAMQLSPENVELVRRIYQQDFELFNYPLDPQPKPPKKATKTVGDERVKEGEDEGEGEGPPHKRSKALPASALDQSPAPVTVPAPPVPTVPLLPKGGNLASLLAAYKKKS